LNNSKLTYELKVWTVEHSIWSYDLRNWYSMCNSIFEIWKI